jgi:4a-hydroxytetrahydrobiopterin dehydratase
MAPRVSARSRLDGRRIAAAAKRVGSGWSILHSSRLRATFRFSDFAQALEFVNAVGALAEEQNHHPDLELSWGRVVVELTTHDAGGLTQKDFTLAAKIDRIPRTLIAKRRGRRRAS